VVLPRDFSDLVEQHGDWVSREVLAVSIGLDDVDEPQLERA
jgi:hypothetical protein